MEGQATPNFGGVDTTHLRLLTNQSMADIGGACCVEDWGDL
jgi:hypothetical protein